MSFEGCVRVCLKQKSGLKVGEGRRSCGLVGESGWRRPGWHFSMPGQAAECQGSREEHVVGGVCSRPKCWALAVPTKGGAGQACEEWSRQDVERHCSSAQRPRRRKGRAHFPRLPAVTVGAGSCSWRRESGGQRRPLGPCGGRSSTGWEEGRSEAETWGVGRFQEVVGGKS